MSFFVKADMDKICQVYEVDEGTYDWIANNCERNNILLIEKINGNYQPYIIAEWCRFDRNIEKFVNGLTCVLYNNKPRDWGKERYYYG